MMKTDDPIRDAENHANREVPEVGICEVCHEPIHPWEDYYDVEGTLLHDDCGLDWLKQYKHYS